MGDAYCHYWALDSSTYLDTVIAPLATIYLFDNEFGCVSGFITGRLPWMRTIDRNNEAEAMRLHSLKNI
jgi:hypothetical protein